MRRGELSYLKGATLRTGTCFQYLQCSCHFHRRFFSANSTSRCKIFNPSEEKKHMHLIYSSCQRSNYPMRRVTIEGLHQSLKSSAGEDREL